MKMSSFRTTDPLGLGWTTSVIRPHQGGRAGPGDRGAAGDVTSVGGPEVSKLIQAQLNTQLVQPVTDAFGLAPAARAHVEAIAALIIGLSFLRQSIQTPGLRELDADQLTALLTPAVQALLDTAPRNTGDPG